MSLICFSDTPKQAFVKGFWKGMAAPVMLFGNFTLPENRKIEPVSLMFKTDEDALAKDWHLIGSDFSKVIEEYGKETSHTK